jgi:hypothetical protein
VHDCENHATAEQDTAYPISANSIAPLAAASQSKKPELTLSAIQVIIILNI